MENKRPAAAEFDLGNAEGSLPTGDFVIPKKKVKVEELAIFRKRVLVLFSGTKSITRALAKYGDEYEVISVDIDGKHKPTHRKDILT